MGQQSKVQLLRWLALLACGVFCIGAVQAAIKSQIIEYRQGDTLLEGYLSYDDSFSGKRPGVLVIHTWTGVGDYIKGRADMLARMGFVAFAPDIYGKGVRPRPPKDAGAEMAKYTSNRPLYRARALSGLEVLRTHALVDTARLTAVGYCFGGTGVLELARTGADLLGVVSFHGGPLSSPTPDDGKKIKARVLVLHGADDPLIRPAAGEDIAKRIPGAVFKSYPKWGHDLPDKMSDTLVADIVPFLRA